jgi:hypothetical protein
MKRILFGIGMLLVVIANAQDKFSFWVGSGYNFDVSPDVVEIPNITLFDSLHTLSTSDIYLGNGMTIGAGGEYELKNGFSAGLVIEYLMGEKNYLEQSFQDSASQQFKDSTFKYVFYSSFTIFKPCFSFVRNTGNLNFVATVGAEIGFGNITRELTKLYPYKTYYEKYLYQGGYAAGMFVKFSVEYFIKPRLAFSGSLGGSALTYMPTEGKLTEAYEDLGTTVDVLNDKPVSERETEFVTSYSYVTGQTDKNKPAKELQPYFNLNAFYFRLGMKFYLETKQEAISEPARKL